MLKCATFYKPMLWDFCLFLWRKKISCCLFHICVQSIKIFKLRKVERVDSRDTNFNFPRECNFRLCRIHKLLTAIYFKGGRYIHSKPDMKPFLYCPSIHKYANKKNPLEEWQTFQWQFPQMVSSVERWQQLNSFFFAFLCFVFFFYIL